MTAVKCRKRNKEQMKQKTNSNMNDLNPILSLVILNVNELNTAIKR